MDWSGLVHAGGTIATIQSGMGCGGTLQSGTVLSGFIAYNPSYASGFGFGNNCGQSYSCPNCGGISSQYYPICPACGHTHAPVSGSICCGSVQPMGAINRIVQNQQNGNQQDPRLSKPKIEPKRNPFFTTNKWDW